MTVERTRHLLRCLAVGIFFGVAAHVLIKIIG